MRVDFNNIKQDDLGRIDPPILVIKKPHNEAIGTLGHHFNLRMELKFNEMSIITFDYPQYVNHIPTPFFNDLTPGKLIQADPYGIFIIGGVEQNNEGETCVRTVTAYSREYELVGKQIVFGAGTYNFWNPVDVENSLLGMILESTRNWKVGNVSASLIGRYRTFDDVDDKVLNFLLNHIQETYECVFVFDSYNRTIDVIDARNDVSMVPVYLSSQNLIKETTVKTNADNLITKLYVCGADDVSIRAVNPTGDNYIYNLDYAIATGDLPKELATKWQNWKENFAVSHMSYAGHTAIRDAQQTRLIVEQAVLSDLEYQLCVLDNTRSTFLQQQMQVSADSDSYTYFAQRLAETAVEYTTIEEKIAKQRNIILDAQDAYEDWATIVSYTNDECQLSAFFTEEELNILDHYLIEDSYTNDTFATFDVGIVEGQDNRSEIDGITLQFDSLKDESGNIVQDFVWTHTSGDGTLQTNDGAMFYGGQLTITGPDYLFQAMIKEGVWETTNGYQMIVSDDGSYLGVRTICSLSVGAGTCNGTPFNSGMLTCMLYTPYPLQDGSTSHLTESIYIKDMTAVPMRTPYTDIFYKDTIYSPEEDLAYGYASYIGSLTVNSMGTSNIYFTYNSSEYQQRTVEQELYFHAHEVLKKASAPTYEFELTSSNFLFAKHFEPFRDVLQLGCGVYVELNDQMSIKPMLLEVHLDFEDPDDFTLVFANTFQRPDEINNFKSIIEKTTSFDRTLQTNKYTFGENRNTTTWVKNLLETGYNAALAQIMAGAEQLVTIDEAGIKIDATDGKTRIYLNNGMIALYDKTTNTVRMGLGRFYNEATGTDFVGVLADIIGGTLLAGQNLIIECPDPNGGVMQFKVDSSGVIINNGRMYMTSAVGAMGWDANYGFFAGTSSLFETTDTGYVVPTCIDSAGNLILDDDGFPEDVNVWVGIDGKVYVRGNVYAEDGVFNGTIYATSGKFQGIVQASDYLDKNGASMVDALGRFKSGYLDLGNITLDGTTGNISMTGSINMSGNITLGGNINLSSGTITWGNNSPVKYQFSVDGMSNWHSTMTSSDYYRRDSLDGGVTWGDPYQFRGKDGTNGADGADGADGSSASIDYYAICDALNRASQSAMTIITGDSVDTVDLYANNIYGGNMYAGDGSDTFFNINGNGFALYHTDAINPKAMLGLNDENTCVSLVLGAGASNYNDIASRFFIEKHETQANLFFYDALSILSGITFFSRGNIGVETPDGGSLYPVANTTDLGNSEHFWDEVYACTGTIITSDRNRKYDIETLPDKYVDMVMWLEPKRFKLTTGSSGRYHVGFIAQDVEEGMKLFGIDSLEFGGWVKDLDSNGNDIYMLRYEEFIAIILQATQKLEKRLVALEGQIEIE